MTHIDFVKFFVSLWLILHGGRGWHISRGGMSVGGGIYGGGG